MNATDQQLPALITALMQRDVYAHDVQAIELIQTHISWVILTGTYAYKIKKPVDFGFLDFSTLEKRHHCCNEELRLNRRLAPAIYLDVIPITGSESAPVLSGQGTAIEFAVKMVQFPQRMQFDHMLERGALTVEHMDAIAHRVADFHQSTDVAEADSTYGSAEAVYLPVAENFRQIRERIKQAHSLEHLANIELRSQQVFEALKPQLEHRRQAGFVRECHGDMHLRNLVWYDDGPVVFDCIEFNPGFRWIDVLSEVAFLIMDLHDRQQHRLAARFLDTYLQHTGDYAGVGVLPFYACYRAMVRAKVAAIRLSQPDVNEDEKKQVTKEFATYLELAESYLQKAEPMLIVSFGMSASGKSTVSQQLLEQLPALRIRSDVERKRLYATDDTHNARQGFGQGMYSQQATRQTYNRLVELAACVLDAGFTVIIDAANLKLSQRELFHRLAAEKSLAYVILEFIAPADILRQRISERERGVSDADLSILEQQISMWRPLAEHERRFAVALDTQKHLDMNAVISAIRAHAKIIPTIEPG